MSTATLTDESVDAASLYADVLVKHMVEFFAVAEREAKRRVEAMRTRDSKNLWMHQDTYLLAGRLAGILDPEIDASEEMNRARSEEIWDELRLLREARRKDTPRNPQPQRFAGGKRIAKSPLTKLTGREAAKKTGVSLPSVQAIKTGLKKKKPVLSR